ncbi:hypothetical protein FW755_08415 [Lonepinella koalarum]|uniref:Tight adherence protein G n=1 Tax=Lonepinella koalarum TaxID=53417 RepID=A0A4R1KX82_9PAST|nr:TadE/TadG family type IV pilus assembly protein [Lonepinella koalarum]MDH2927793.1 hypothetical protein [Lonepinella koalarum]TCK69986.1 tight adherence protein G [Lonepinella koalarum]TFJ90411.1 hypothetical protein E0709_03465 [Lonepinella koalarum]TYG35108.1 hypothetical protein FW755_08415 [Lonepinella koalarum]
MMKKIFYFAKPGYNTLFQFYKNESGVYTVMMGILSFVLLGLIAFAVDGSGLLLDKARFVQGMEQASLALVTENNANRQNPKHYDVTRQPSDSLDPKEKLMEQQDKRNKELVSGIVRSYYLGNTYRPNNQEVKDQYDYYCGTINNDLGANSKTVACYVSGNFDRPSWIYLKDQPLSFAKVNNISSGAIYAQKNLDEVAPLDLMLVSDFSGSMNSDVNNRETYLYNNSKLAILKDVVESIGNDLLDVSKAERENRNISPFNRIGFTAFALGAQQKNNTGYCYLPFSFKGRSSKLPLSNRTNFYELVSYINNNVDLSATINKIASFNGTDISYSVSFSKNDFCLKDNDNHSTTDFWFTKEQHSTLNDKFRSLKANGATLSSSGLLIGANYLMDKNNDPEAQPAKLKTNTQRILLVLSDGRDEITSYAETSITTTIDLINHGLCEKVRQKLDSLQDASYTTRPTRIAFVAFGYELLPDQKTAWKKCVGADYYEASNKQQLLNTFRQIVGIEEEVGHSLSEKPTFNKN